MLNSPEANRLLISRNRTIHSMTVNSWDSYYMYSLILIHIKILDLIQDSCSKIESVFASNELHSSFELKNEKR